MTHQAALAALVLWAVPPPPSPMPTVYHEPCPGRVVTSCYIDTQPVGQLYLAPGLAQDFAPQLMQHELGHAYDIRDLNDGERRRIAKVMRWRKWPEERFANFYAGCRLGYSPRTDPRLYWPWRSFQHVAARCRLIARAGIN